MRSPQVLETAHTLRQFVQEGVEFIREGLEGTASAEKFSAENILATAESIFDTARAVVAATGVPEEHVTKATLVMLSMQGLAAYCMVCGIDPSSLVLPEPRNPVEALLQALGMDPSALDNVNEDDDDR